MKSDQLYGVLHAESELDRQRRANAAALLERLESDHTSRLERTLAGAAMLHGFNWQISVSRYAFAAGYRKAGYFAGLTITLSVGTVSSWGDVEPLFTSLDSAGIPMDKWVSSDQPASYTRQYEATLQKDSPDEENPVGELIVRVIANLPGDTNTCRRVIVGYTDPVQSRPEPIYKLECEGESTDESEAQRSSDDQPL
jgi:hypothetical protein